MSAIGADVVIVGAGLAGLAVATSLHERGVAVRSFEARQRVGGRLLSAAPHGQRRLDLGATWFWFGNGADSLALALADRLPTGTVVSGAAVQRVEAGDGRLAVVADGHSVQAAHVVIAVPPALAASTIEFVPGLPDP